MRSGTAAGLIHEAAYYGSDDEFLALIVPFLAGGLNAGEPTFAVFNEPEIALLRDALPEPSEVTFLSSEVQYDRPAATIRTYRQILAAQVAAVRPIRGSAAGGRLPGPWPRPVAHPPPVPARDHEP